MESPTVIKGPVHTAIFCLAAVLVFSGELSAQGGATAPSLQSATFKEECHEKH